MKYRVGSLLEYSTPNDYKGSLAICLNRERRRTGGRISVYMFSESDDSFLHSGYYYHEKIDYYKVLVY